MTYTFDGINKLCVLGAGVTTLDVGDMYSRWKEWVAAGDNTKFLPFLDVVGGNPTVGANAIASYFFILNGWKIRPQEASHTLTVAGIVNVDGGGDPFTDTVGNWRVRIVQVVPMQAETIAVSGDGAGGGLTADQSALLVALAQIHGLVPGVPLVVGPTSRVAGDVVQAISEANGIVTVARA